MKSIYQRSIIYLIIALFIVMGLTIDAPGIQAQSERYLKLYVPFGGAVDVTIDGEETVYECLLNLDDRFAEVVFLCKGTPSRMQFGKSYLENNHIDQKVTKVLSGRLFFLNVCESGTNLRRAESLAKRFVEFGASAVIGVLGEIPIRRIIAFARRFLHFYVFLGKSVYESCRLTKSLGFIEGGDPAFLLYVVYGTGPSYKGK